MFGLGPAEVLLIVLVILILFGPKRLPELAKALGKAKRIFEQETKKPGKGQKEKKEPAG